MKMEEHFKETLNRAVANEPPVLDAWDRFEQRAVRGRRVRFVAAFAAAAAVAVASVIVVPRLGSDPVIQLPPATQPPTTSPSPSPTVDKYPGWATYEYDLYDFTLRHPKDWRVMTFEADPEVLAPGQRGTAEGGETMAVSLALINEEFDSPELRQQGFDRSTREDGRPFVWTERIVDGRTFVDHRFDWSTCLRPEGTPSCVRTARTLVVTIHIGTHELSELYRESAERIVTSIEYTGPEGPFVAS